MARNNKTLFDCLLALAAACLVAAIAGATEFTVVNKCNCPPQFTVINKTYERPARTGSVFSFRSPRGHTHTCTSCGESWDHQANSSHTCANCGGHPPISRGGGYLADPTPRMVKVKTAERASFQVVNRTPAPVTQSYTWDHFLATTGVSAGNCANGQCSSPQAPKFHLFR